MKKKARQQLSCWRATAETEGFEPSIPFGGIHTFQACLFNHSSRSPLVVKGGKNKDY